jgi:phage/plasmid-like protein (TIGR03299 family)
MFESGFFVEQPAWHGLGNVIPKGKRLSVEEGLVAAGMDWDVGMVPLVIADDPKVPKKLRGKPVHAMATYRSSDMSILGDHVGMRYTPLQNYEAFEWFQPFLDSKEAELHTAGSLNKGRVTWVLAKIARKAMKIVANDEVEKYILLSNSHDGTKAVKVGFTPIRVVCANTLAMAHGNQASKLLRVKHSKNVLIALEKVRETVDLWNERFEATAKQYRFLARHGVSAKDLEKYVTMVMANLDEDEFAGYEVSTRMSGMMQEVFALMEEGMGMDNPKVKGTWWAAYNAFTEYLSYQRSRNPNNRLRELWYGGGVKMNQRALDIALQLAS